MQFGLPTLSQFALWCLVTLSLAVISWRSLRNPRCHGFFRFFAFATAAAVLIPNIVYWQRELFAPHQLASWGLLFSALALLVSGLYLLKTRGGHRPQQVAEHFHFEDTGELIQTGVFQFIRHPMYSALILFTWGVWLKHATWLGLGLCLATTVLLWLTAKTEERENIAFFGEAYQRYRESTKRFIPYLF